MRSSLVIGDAEGGEVPGSLPGKRRTAVSLPLKKMAKAIPGSWINMIALGLAGGLPACPPSPGRRGARELEARRGRRWHANLKALHAGMTAAADIGGLRTPRRRRSATPPPPTRRWLISGNEAAGFGALRGGVRFVAAYPITPATELLEWMAPALTKVGGSLLQAEDELASVNMIIGASYRRRAVADRDRRPRPVADDRSASAWPSPPKCRSWSST